MFQNMVNPVGGNATLTTYKSWTEDGGYNFKLSKNGTVERTYPYTQSVDYSDDNIRFQSTANSVLRTITLKRTGIVISNEPTATNANTVLDGGGTVTIPYTSNFTAEILVIS